MLSLLPAAVSAARPEAASYATPHQQQQRPPTAFEWRSLVAPVGSPPNDGGGQTSFAFPRQHEAPPPGVACGNDAPSPKMAAVSESGGALFRPPMNSEYSPPSPRLYPPPYSPYFSPQPHAASPPSPSAPYFFPFPHPFPPRHYLQIESYSAVLASMGAAPPPRPTPIFSASPSVVVPAPFGPPYPQHPFGGPQGPTPATKSPPGAGAPLFGSSSECPSLSPASSQHSPSPQSKYSEFGGGSPPSPFFTSGKEGSLKHRFLVRPAGQLGSNTDLTSSFTLNTTAPGLPDRAGGSEAHPGSPHGETTQPPSPKRSRSSPSPKAAVATTAATSATKAKPAAILQPHYPRHFQKGSIVQLADGELKCVEELRTEDFVKSAESSSDLQIDSSTVVKIEEKAGLGTVALGFSVGERRIQVCVEATVEHPFFVFGQGWSSCFPERTLQRFSLSCHQLQVGDVCISLTQRHTRHSESSSSAVVLRPALSTAIISQTIPVHSAQRRKRRWSASDALTLMAVNIPVVEQRSNSLTEAVDEAP